MSMPSSVPRLIEDSPTLERSGDIVAALAQVREVLDLARSEVEPGAIAVALVGVAGWQPNSGREPYARRPNLCLVAGSRCLAGRPPDPGQVPPTGCFQGTEC